MSVTDVKGPLIVVEGVRNVGFGEIVQISTVQGELRKGQVLEVSKDKAVVQIFEGTQGIETHLTKIRFVGKPFLLPVSKEILGRTFSGGGAPLDGKPPVMPESRVNINGDAINPYRREHPKEFIQTGISAIDIMNTLVRGQKLPLFSAAGLPHNQLAAQIIKQSTVIGSKQRFAVVFGAMGITNEEYLYFRKQFESSSSASNLVMFVNTAGDPTIERLITPRLALSAAEYLANKLGMHTLVILSDMTNYCEALREISASRGEIPGRRGYPGYMYTDLASIYERAGRIHGSEGSITLLPIISMPDGDITHPIADLTGYITEGQIVLSRDLHAKGIFPPIDVLPSLSRLMKNGIGKNRTREDHQSVSNQLYFAYSRSLELRDLAAVIGDEALTELDRDYIDFGKSFEENIIGQGNTNRNIETSLGLAWKNLGVFPETELKRIPPEMLAEFRHLLKQESR